MGAVDAITKVLGVLTAILGTAGYVLVLGAAILWLRLHQVDLPTEVPVSLASRGELIAIGAQAVAVWVLLMAALGGLAAWIVSGTPERRRFGFIEAGLALAVTVSTLLALETNREWMLVFPALAATIAVVGAIVCWPSLDRVLAVLLPTGVGAALAVGLSMLGNHNGAATVIGATSIFAILVLLTPPLQRWRELQEANRNALVQVEAKRQVAEGDREHEAEADPLVVALEGGGGGNRSPALVWIGRVTLAFVALVALGVVAVASQLDREENFHGALVSLTNGDCLSGTYVARGNEQIVLAEPNRNGNDEQARISTIPVAQILEVQVYGNSLEGLDLARDKHCTHSPEALVHPESPAKSTPPTSPKGAGAKAETHSP